MRGKLGLALGVGAASALALVVSLMSVSVAGPNVSRLAVSSMRPPTPSSISPRTAIRPVICSRSTTSCSTPGTRTWWGRIRGSAFGSRWAWAGSAGGSTSSKAAPARSKGPFRWGTLGDGHHRRHGSVSRSAREHASRVSWRGRDGVRLRLPDPDAV